MPWAEKIVPRRQQLHKDAREAALTHRRLQRHSSSSTSHSTFFAQLRESVRAMSLREYTVNFNPGGGAGTAAAPPDLPPEVGGDVVFRHDFGGFQVGDVVKVFDVRWRKKRNGRVVARFLVGFSSVGAETADASGDDCQQRLPSKKWVPQFLPTPSEKMDNIPLIQRSQQAAVANTTRSPAPTKFRTNDADAKRRLAFDSHAMQAALDHLWGNSVAPLLEWPRSFVPRQIWSAIMTEIAIRLVPSLSSNRSQLAQCLDTDWEFDARASAALLTFKSKHHAASKALKTETEAGGVSRNQFLWSLFELADQFLDSVNAKSYIQFLDHVSLVVSDWASAVGSGVGTCAVLSAKDRNYIPPVATNPIVWNGDIGLLAELSATTVGAVTPETGSSSLPVVQSRSPTATNKTLAVEVVGARSADDCRKNDVAKRSSVARSYAQPHRQFRPLKRLSLDQNPAAGRGVPVSPTAAASGTHVRSSGTQVVFVDDTQATGNSEPVGFIGGVAIPVNLREWDSQAPASDAGPAFGAALANGGQPETYHGFHAHLRRSLSALSLQEELNIGRRQHMARGARRSQSAQNKRRVAVLRTNRQTVVGARAVLRQAPRTAGHSAQDPLVCCVRMYFRNRVFTVNLQFSVFKYFCEFVSGECSATCSTKQYVWVCRRPKTRPRAFRCGRIS